MAAVANIRKRVPPCARALERSHLGVLNKAVAEGLTRVRPCYFCTASVGCRRFLLAEDCSGSMMTVQQERIFSTTNSDDMRS